MDIGSWPTIAAVAKRLGKSPSTVRRLALAGELRRVRDEDDPVQPWRFEPASVEAFVQGMQTAQTGDGPGSGTNGAEKASGATAALISRALAENLTPRQIMERYQLDPQDVLRHVAQIAELEAAGGQTPGALERIKQLEQDNEYWFRLTKRVEVLERDQAKLCRLVSECLSRP